jgi:hypothetical protein
MTTRRQPTRAAAQVAAGELVRWSDGLVPEPLEDAPRVADAGRVCRAHLGPAGIPPIQLGVHQGPDVDAIDRLVHDLAVDVNVDQFDAPHHDPAQVDPAEPGAGQVDRAELRAAEVNALDREPRRSARIKSTMRRH